MKLPKELTTVTPLSKAIALLMFISLPIIAFFFGMRYQTMIQEGGPTPTPTPIQTIRVAPMPVACTEDAKICPDGTAVGRVAPGCMFEECPQNDILPTPERLFCGGIAGKTCPSGFYCKYDGTYPDAGGSCIQEKKTTTYSCPENEYVDCMPGPGVKRPECASSFLLWAKENCPNFKGAAY